MVLWLVNVPTDKFKCSYLPTDERKIFFKFQNIFFVCTKRTIPGSLECESEFNLSTRQASRIFRSSYLPIVEYEGWHFPQQTLTEEACVCARASILYWLQSLIKSNLGFTKLCMARFYAPEKPIKACLCRRTGTKWSKGSKALFWEAKMSGSFHRILWFN